MKWGLRTDLILTGIIIIALVVAIFYIMRVSSMLDTNKQDSSKTSSTENNKPAPDEDTYQDLEWDLMNASITYVDSFYGEGIDFAELKVTLAVLEKNNIIEGLFDLGDGTKCDGYALITIDQEYMEISSKPFIKCSGYKTEGFEDWRLG